VDLLRSLGLYLGLQVLDVPGATGFTDTDYAAKGAAAVAALAQHDFVFVHVEAPDECGHMGDPLAKAKALERIDADVLGPLLASEWARQEKLRILVCPDHPTPCALKAHATEPVPFLAWGAGHPKTGLAYTEADAKRSPFRVGPGHELMRVFHHADWETGATP